MTTSTPEDSGTAQVTAASETPKATKKASPAPRRAHVAPAKAKSAKKASSAKKGAGAKETAKTAKRDRKPKAQAAAARAGSKTAKVLDLLKRPGGVTAKELMRATGWQPHSIRGFLSGTVGKKMGLAVTSTKGEDGERSYSVKA
ncbi:MAG: DUF3489 domain-containing protein [Bryobacteraceae bacterium]|jgi:hypothetical protein